METQSAAVNQVWQEALTRIESQLSKPSFEAFLKAMRPVTLDRDVFVFSVPSLFAKEWLEGRYRGLIAETLREVLTRGVDVRFVVSDIDIPAPRTAPGLQEIAASGLKVGAVDSLTFTGKYTFDTFVVGSGNRFAHAAALAVAEAPARAYNPLFIYGGVGLGKTHLLQAIGHRVLTNKQIARVTYVSSERFTNEMINAIRDDKMVEFRNRYRNVDVLLIDDIQFLAGKERTQEEFFHTFNTLHESSRQLIISSDRQPREIPTLEDRLRSRFEWGLIADIEPPDYETRIAILRKKAELDGIAVPDEVTQYIAQRISSNIRELEGALSRLRAHAEMQRTPISIDLADRGAQRTLTTGTHPTRHHPRNPARRRRVLRYPHRGNESQAPHEGCRVSPAGRDVPLPGTDRCFASTDRRGVRRTGPHDRHARL